MDVNDAGSADLRILIVEDIETDSELCCDELERGGLHFSFRRVDTREGLEQALKSAPPDLILCDFSMPGAFDGMTALHIARAYAPETPFIFLSGVLGEERIVEAMRAGAADCVLKDHLERLVPAVRRALLESARRRAERQKHDTVDAVEAQLREALAAGQFILHYQPRVSLENGAVCGLEALIRWDHPELGLLLADEFVPTLERSGLIVDVGRWALKRAALDADAWRAAGSRVPPVGVNVSAVQLRQDDFVEKVTGAIAEAGTDSEIDLELTESVMMSDVETNARKLEALRAAGIKIAIDDFGTGYSSLSYLAHLPADALKINRAFVGALGTPVHTAIVTTIISLAKCLNLRSVAEGVETREEAELLHELECDEGQGYLYSHPVPAYQVASMLERLRSQPGAPAARA
jgi:EAL domain-containing protein (putative c-di-GMP-specific phosphodiesterase class I)/CheY-like chemotaxis protein